MKGQLVDVVAAVRVDVLLVNARAFSSSCFFYLVCFLTRLFVWPSVPSCYIDCFQCGRKYM